MTMSEQPADDLPSAEPATPQEVALRRQLQRARELLVIAERDGIASHFHRHGESNAARALREAIHELLARRVP